MNLNKHLISNIDSIAVIKENSFLEQTDNREEERYSW